MIQHKIYKIWKCIKHEILWKLKMYIDLEGKIETNHPLESSL